MKTLLTALVVCSFVPFHARAQSLAPAGWAGGVKLAEAKDTNPDPDEVDGAVAGALR